MINFQINFNLYEKRSLLSLLTLVFALNPLFFCLSQAKEFPTADKLVVFKGETAAFSGFFGKQGDKIYVFTSMHALGGTGFNVFTKEGKQLKTGSVEVASDRDIVRISIDETPVGFFETDSQVTMGQTVTIGTASSPDPKKTTFMAEGRDSAVTGIGPEILSLNKTDKAPYLFAGSPVITGSGKAVGVVSCDIPVLEKTDLLKADPKKPEPFLKLDWGSLVCSRFSDDIKWLAVDRQELVFQMKTMLDSRGFIGDYAPLCNTWQANPYGKIEIAAPRAEIKPWLEEHNRKMENSAKNIANIAKDPNHFQEQAKKMQETARDDGIRLTAFASSRAAAMKNMGLTPYMKYYASGMSSFLDEISCRINARASSMAYISPISFSPKKPEVKK